MTPRLYVNTVPDLARQLKRAGVSAKLATAIASHREAHGAFAGLAELLARCPLPVKPNQRAQLCRLHAAGRLVFATPPPSAQEHARLLLAAAAQNGECHVARVQLVRDVTACIKLNNMLQSTVAQQAKVSRGVLSQWLALKYPHDNTRVDTAMSRWLTAHQDRQGLSVTWADRTLATSTAQFGTQQVGPEHQDAEVVLADSTGRFNLADPLDGSAKLNMNAAGKIVLVERGNVAFVEKAMNAQNAGAAAVIIYNNQDGGPARMSDDGYGTISKQITIPVVSISKADGFQLAAAINAGRTTLSFQRAHKAQATVLLPFLCQRPTWQRRWTWRQSQWRPRRQQRRWLQQRRRRQASRSRRRRQQQQQQQQQ